MNKSFTLIEILVVIVVIGILSAFILVGMSSISESANIAKSKAFSDSLRNSLLDNLVSEWKLDGSASDSWGTNNGTWSGPTGSYTSASWRTSSECVSNGCLAFDGTDDYINFGTNSSLTLLRNFTFNIWVYFTNDNLISPIVEWGGYWSGYMGIRVQRNATNYLYGYYGNSSARAYVVDTNVSPKNKWINVVALRNGDYFYLYINSKKLNPSISVSGDIVYNNGNRYLGKENLNYFSGSLDNFIVYNESLSSSQINQNYYVGLNQLFKNNQISLDEFNQRIADLKSNLVAHE